MGYIKIPWYYHYCAIVLPLYFLQSMKSPLLCEDWHPVLKPLAQLPHEYKTSLTETGAGLKTSSPKCSMGVVTLTLYRGRVPLSRVEQGKGRTNGQHTDPVKRRIHSTWVQRDRIHIHTCMYTQQFQRPPAECCVDMHKSFFSQDDTA